VSAATGSGAPRAERAAWVAAWLLALVALTCGLGSAALIDPDEGRNAEVARELVAGGELTVPHLGGLPYLDKPILFFWVAAGSIALLGPSELAARLPSLLATLGTVVLVAAFAWRRLGRTSAGVAGLALATSPLVIAYARIVIFDAMLMFWVTAACLALLVASERPGRAWPVAAWAAIGAACLTKGPVGLLLPLLVALGHAAACRRPLGRIFDPLGLLVFAGVVAPWFAAVTVAHPEFPHYAFVRETLQRVATDQMRRTGPVWYFLPLLLVGALPWSLVPWFATGRLREAWRRRAGAEHVVVYLVLWILLPTLFFSLSQSKRPGYILPVFPALALLVAWLFREAVARRRAAWTLAGACALGAVVVPIAARLVGSRLEPAVIGESVERAVPLFAAGLVATGIVAALGARRNSALAVTLAFVLLPATGTLGALGIYRTVAEERSTRGVAESIRGVAASQTPEVLGIRVSPHSLSFYLEQPLLLATHNGYEMGSNYIGEYVTDLRNAPNSPLRPLDGWRDVLRGCARPTLFLVSDLDEPVRRELAAHLPLVVETRRWAVYGPCLPEA
jgi:4-amino-4-deoxy-L-arabinose transferase-like glycosyltransferase